MRLARRRWLVLGAAMLASAGARAEVALRDAQQVRAVVEAQLDAFARDDAARAFSYAAPGIRAQFETAERFAAMVRNSYPAVVRPASVGFMQPSGDAEVVNQPVQLTDAAGTAWLAVYTLQRQPDGAWRIAGCTLARSQPGRST